MVNYVDKADTSIALKCPWQWREPLLHSSPFETPDEDCQRFGLLPGGVEKDIVDDGDALQSEIERLQSLRMTHGIWGLATPSMEEQQMLLDEALSLSTPPPLVAKSPVSSTPPRAQPKPTSSGEGVSWMQIPCAKRAKVVKPKVSTVKKVEKTSTRVTVGSPSSVELLSDHYDYFSGDILSLKEKIEEIPPLMVLDESEIKENDVVVCNTSLPLPVELTEAESSVKGTPPVSNAVAATRASTRLRGKRTVVTTPSPLPVQGHSTVLPAAHSTIAMQA